MPSPGYVIRDGLESDIDSCLALDHDYETEYVWQMRITPGTTQWQVSFAQERLPRTMEVTYPADAKRLKLALPSEHCFLVAALKDEPEIMGYLTMRQEPAFSIARIQDIVVSYPYRGKRIGTKLLNVARRWAEEHELRQLLVEVQTKNYPGIQFCQNRGLMFCGFNDQYFPNQDIAVFLGQPLR